MSSTAAERERALTLVRRWSTAPESALLRYDAPWRYLFPESVEGVAAWIEAHGVAVVWGDPACELGNEEALVRELISHFDSRKLKACLLLIEHSMARAALDGGFVVVNVGADAVFDLTTWRLPRGDSGKSLRWSLNRARRAGFEVGEYRRADGRSDELELEIAKALAAWETSLSTPPAASILSTSPLRHVGDKRLFTARRGGRLEAVLACSPVPAAAGWYLEDLIRVPGAAVGASELLVVEALQRLAFAGARMASIGVAPSLDNAGQIDRRARLLLTALRPLVSGIDRRYRFRALTTYKEKFRPTEWRPRYVAIRPGRPSVRLARGVRSVLG